MNYKLDQQHWAYIKDDIIQSARTQKHTENIQQHSAMLCLHNVMKIVDNSIALQYSLLTQMSIKSFILIYFSSDFPPCHNISICNLSKREVDGKNDRLMLSNAL